YRPSRAVSAHRLPDTGPTIAVQMPPVPGRSCTLVGRRNRFADLRADTARHGGQLHVGFRRLSTYPSGMITVGISQLPPDGVSDADFLDDLVEQGFNALELPFVTDFPWKEKRCAEFGKVAAERRIRLSVHAPYFATLTPEDPERGAQCLAALEHTMKLGRALGAAIIVAHGGSTHGEPAEVLLNRISERLERVAPKVEKLGVGLGLETAGKEGAWGTLGDIALVAARFSFVRPVV